MSIAKWYERNFTWVNGVVAVAFGLALFFWDRWCGGTALPDFLSKNHRSLYGVLAAVYASLLGFTITTVSLILGFSSSPKLALVRESEHYSTIWSIFKSAMRWLAVATVSAIIVLIPDGKSDFVRVVTYFLTALLTYIALLLGRCIWVLEHIIDLVTKER